MNDKGAETLALRFAKAIFDLRSKGRKYRTTEAHLSEKDLATVLAVFGQAMWDHGYACGKGQHPPAPVDEAGKLVKVAQKPSEQQSVATGAGPSASAVAAALRTLNGSSLGGATVHCPQLGPQEITTPLEGE